jgi:hypothetical protein
MWVSSFLVGAWASESPKILASSWYTCWQLIHACSSNNHQSLRGCSGDITTGNNKALLGCQWLASSHWLRTKSIVAVFHWAGAPLTTRHSVGVLIRNDRRPSSIITYFSIGSEPLKRGVQGSNTGSCEFFPSFSDSAAQCNSAHRGTYIDRPIHAIYGIIEWPLHTHTWQVDGWSTPHTHLDVHFVPLIKWQTGPDVRNGSVCHPTPPPPLDNEHVLNLFEIRPKQLLFQKGLSAP